MKCKECVAFGVDHLSFRGCLIGHIMEDFFDGTEGCRLRKATIDKEVAKVKEEDPRAKRYRWLHQNKE